MQNNQIVNLNKALNGIHSDIFKFDHSYYVTLISKVMIGLEVRDFGTVEDEVPENDVINLIEELDNVHFNLDEAVRACKEAAALVIDYRGKIIGEGKVINLESLILKLNELSGIRDHFKAEEKKLGELLSELLKIMDTLPKKGNNGKLKINWGDEVFDEEEDGTWIENCNKKLQKKIEELVKDETSGQWSGGSLKMILSNCSDLIQRMVRLEGFGEEDEGGEDDEEGEEIYRRRNRLLATTKLYIILHDLNLSRENINGFIKYLMDRGKYPADEKLEGWDIELLKLINSKYNINNFSFEELFKIAVGDLSFLEIRFKEDKDVMNHLRKEALNKFQGSSGIDVDIDDVLYSLKEKMQYLDDDLKNMMYRYVAKNFETNNCVKLLKMFDDYTFPKFLNFYHHYVKRIDLSVLGSGKFYKFYDLLKIADERTSDFTSILSAVKALGAKDDERIFGLINRGFMILRTLHNNDYGKPDANPKTYDFKFDDFLKDLFLAMMASKWDLKQDVTDKFINIGLNKKIDKILETRGERIKIIADQFGINFDKFRHDLLEIRRIISEGAEIPFSWREKIYQVDNDLNSLLSGEILLKYTSEVKPKDKRLFNLNYEMGNGMRFEVLPDMSLDHFKVGAATQCCQRPGGAAETSMIDSFMNGLAGVLVLKKGRDIISQSYFHYVPADNGYILDNVEANVRLVKKNEINLDNLYANLAERIKKDFGASYVKCGKHYNKLSDSLFESGAMDGDPRYFELGEVYTDFRKEDHLDLTNPKFPVILVDMRKKEANKFDRLLKFAEAFGVMVRFGSIQQRLQM